MQHLELRVEDRATLKMVAPDGKWEDYFAVKIISRNGVAWRELSTEDLAAIHEWTGQALAQRADMPAAAE